MMRLLLSAAATLCATTLSYLLACRFRVGHTIQLCSSSDFFSFLLRKQESILSLVRREDRFFFAVLDRGLVLFCYVFVAVSLKIENRKIGHMFKLNFEKSAILFKLNFAKNRAFPQIVRVCGRGRLAWASLLPPGCGKRLT